MLLLRTVCVGAALAAGPAVALTPVQEKACVMASVRQLPTGTTVAASRFKPAAEDHPEIFRLELDVRTSGLDATYAFYCSMLDEQTPLAAPIGLVK